MAGTVIEQINECLDSKTNFLLSGGAGSGKTYTLIQTLRHVFEHDPKARVACITYTNVAANEIKERSPYSKLQVSTIHDFLWLLIKDFQKNLKQTILALIITEKERPGSGLVYSGENEVDANSFKSVEYQNYRDIENGIISHDDLLKIANYMFAQYPLLSKILCDKFDYIFIDEYQDTQKAVIEIFLEHITAYAKEKPCIGFFGDRMQSIYDSGIGNIQSFIDGGVVREIKKSDNYRCSTSVIELLNRIRSDIKQEPAKKNADGSIANKKGSAIFIYSQNDFDLDSFKQSKFVTGWNFDDPKHTKVLFLTHRLIARRLGFNDLLASYGNTDRLLGNEPDKLASHLLNVGGILYHFELKDFAFVIGEIQRRINTNADKQRISSILSGLLANQAMSIEAILDKFDEERFVRKDDRLDEFIENHIDVYNRIKDLPFSQVMAYYTYYNDFSPYSTQHGIKGAEFDNVLVIMDNGKWNNYNFKYYFEKTPPKDTIIQRTERIFYVCCSRAMDNLVVYYPSPTAQVILQAKSLFGESNVHKI